MKVCIKCKVPKELDQYSKNNSTIDGLNTRCKSCLHDKYINDKLKPDFILKRNENFKKHKNNNPEYYKIKDKENYQNNIDLWKIKNKIYKSENKDKINQQLKDKYNADPLWRLKAVIRTNIKHGFKSNNINKLIRTEQILGCTFEQFKEYIESQFEPWMNWENKSKNKIPNKLNETWDLDHKIPISSAKTEEDVLRLNHYTNFQPLCSYTNRYIKINNIEWTK